MSNGIVDDKNQFFSFAEIYKTFKSLDEKSLTKRELIAAMCLQGLLSTLTIERDAHSKFLAETAVMHADALLKELSTNKESGE